MAAAFENSANPKFVGEFRHKVEGKNRITIPASWRFQEDVQLFMIRKTLKNCISVMPQAEVSRIEAEAELMEPADRSDFFDIFGSRLRGVVLDKGGRVSIPEEFFGLLKLPEAREVWLSGSVRIFNVWSIADFEAAQPVEEARTQSVLRRLGI